MASRSRAIWDWWTARNIAASETLFRLGIVAHLIGEALFVFVALALYDLLKAANHRNALCMLTLILVAIPIAFLNELNAIAPSFWCMELISSPCLTSLNAMHWPCFSSMCMGTDLMSPEYFWAFGCFRLGSWCTGRAFFPASLGVALMVNCFALLISSLTSLVLPHYEALVHGWMRPFHFGEQAFMLWLLIMGAKPKPLASPASYATPS